MAGDIKGKPHANSPITLTTTGASLTDKSAAAAGTDLDMRGSGNAEGARRGRFEIKCQWATITGIAAGKIIGELYLIPKIDGTNTPQIDTTSGASILPQSCFFGTFVATKAPSANTDAYFVTRQGDLPQQLCSAYVKNMSGQTISANWTLKAAVEHDQYS